MILSQVGDPLINKSFDLGFFLNREVKRGEDALSYNESELPAPNPPEVLTYL